MFYVAGWLLCCLAPSQLPPPLPPLNSTGAAVGSALAPDTRALRLQDDGGGGGEWEATDAAVVVWLLLGSRALIGVALGFVCTSVAPYQTELAPTSIRGAIGLFSCKRLLLQASPIGRDLSAIGLFSCKRLL